MEEMTPMTTKSRQPSSDSIEIDPILYPGIVHVNVQGAFIVTEDSAKPGTNDGDGAKHDTDIRLPNHRSVVSHVALDVLLQSYEQERRLMHFADWRLTHKACLLLS